MMITNLKVKHSETKTMNLTTLICHLFLLSQTTNATEELTQATFTQTINSGKNGIVKFYQTWCGHCVRMKPDWDNLATTAHSSVFVADVNCGEEQDLCEEHGVSGYPTIKYYIDGQENDYNEARSYEALQTFVTDKLAKKCDVNDASTCSEKEQKYMKKWEGKDIAKEKNRLEGMQNSIMSAELKSWLNDRVYLLNKMSGDDSGEL